MDQAPTLDAGSDPGGTADSFDEILKKVVQSGPAEELGSGSELAGRFKITRVLGEGGMGTVYVARDMSLGREVAIKVHRSGGALRLRREAVAMARLAHPNVVTVFEVGELAGRPFVVMEYVTGTTLRAWLAAEPRSVREILGAVIAAGEGLAAAHDAGLVHRDFKPENVLIGVDGRARVGDFGLARGSKSGENAASPQPQTLAADLTRDGAIVGTPAYMAPEQARGADVDARADQYAFCVVAWESLAGARPREGKLPARIRRVLERGLAA